MDEAGARLLVTMGFLSIYVIGVGGTTATAIRIRESWRHLRPEGIPLESTPGADFTLSAPSVPTAIRRLQMVGWTAFPIALGLALFVNPANPLVVPLAVIVMVALNAIYFTAMQGMGEPLTMTRDGFLVGAHGRQRSVRWIHVTELTGARVGAFKGMKMSEKGEWQDPKLVPNVIFYRLNHALVRSRKTLAQRLTGFTYYDGVIRNVFGVPTDQLLDAMREWQRRAVDAEAPPFRRPRPGERVEVRPPS
ncbi:MAG: hypothetical protein M3082_20555 [Candidatus Dormibacteraeota bacterium]|nr:hypothetical protein [Candidatus Dormibacteraeota bacterium]